MSNFQREDLGRQYPETTAPGSLTSTITGVVEADSVSITSEDVADKPAVVNSEAK